MKQKQKKDREVSVHSSQALNSGPQPDVKVNKHFEAVLKVSCRSPQDGTYIRSKLVNNLPSFIINDLEDQEEGHSQVQHQILESRLQDNKRKW
jgi:hypothetical protein